MKMKDCKCNTQATVILQVSETRQSTSRMNKRYSNMLYLQYHNKYNFELFLKLLKLLMSVRFAGKLFHAKLALNRIIL